MKPFVLAVLFAALAGCALPGGPPPEDPGDGHGPLGRRFRSAEEWVKRFDDPARDGWQRPDEVVRLLGIEPGMTVVDLGAGTGYFLKRLSRAAGEKGIVLALDIEPDMVRYMAERRRREGLGNVRAVQVPHDDPRLGPGSVHRVLIVDTWHHIPDRGAYAAKLARSLAPGGVVLVVDYTLESPRGPRRDHRLPPEAVAGELEAGGLEARIVEESLPEQYAVLGRLPAR